MYEDHLNKNLDVICLGNAMIDIIFTHLDHLPKIGEELYIDTYDIGIGGAAAITSIGLRKLNLSTAIVASYGDDLLGTYLYQTLNDSGIDLRGFQRDYSSATSLSIELSFPQDRATVTCAKSSDHILVNNAKNLLNEARHIHIRGLSKSRIELLKKAVQCGLTTSVDLDFQIEIQHELFWDAHRYIDFITPNRAEVSTLVGNGDVRTLARTLGQKLRKYCVVKMDRDGSIGSDGQCVVEVEAFPATVVDTTGAGDSFNAGFIYGFLKGYTLEQCMLLGNGMGSLNVRKAGGAAAMPNFAMLKELVKTRHFDI